MLTSRQQIFTYAEIVADTAIRNFVLSRDDKVEGADSSFTTKRFYFAKLEGEAQAKAILNQHYRAGNAYPTVIKWEWGRWDLEKKVADFKSAYAADPDANALRIIVQGKIKSNVFDKVIRGFGRDLTVTVSALAVHDEELMSKALYPHYIVVEPIYDPIYMLPMPPITIPIP